jgi:hypothetical protein
MCGAEFGATRTSNMTNNGRTIRESNIKAE